MKINKSSNSKLVSIGIPTYNRPDGLRSTLECVSKQTYNNIEIIISDNCSDEGRTESIAREYQEKDPKIKYIRQTTNIGAAANFEYLKNIASGDYFAWMADDDLCEPTFIEMLVEELDSDPNTVLVTSDVIVINNDGEKIAEHELESIRKHISLSKVRRLFFRYPTTNIFFSVYGLYRLEALQNIDVVSCQGYKGYLTNSEVPFLAKLSLEGRIASIPIKLKYYRSHSDSVYYREVNTITSRDVDRLKRGVRLALLKIAWNSRIPLSDRLQLIVEVIKPFLRDFIIGNGRRILKACLRS